MFGGVPQPETSRDGPKRPETAVFGVFLMPPANYLAMLQRARAATALLGEQCPVCFDAYRGAPDHTIVTRFNCQHQCCAECADNWRREHSRLTATCPICRAHIGSAV